MKRIFSVLILVLLLFSGCTENAPSEYEIVEPDYPVYGENDIFFTVGGEITADTETVSIELKNNSGKKMYFDPYAFAVHKLIDGHWCMRYDAVYPPDEQSKVAVLYSLDGSDHNSYEQELYPAADVGELSPGKYHIYFWFWTVSEKPNDNNTFYLDYEIEIK